MFVNPGTFWNMQWMLLPSCSLQSVCLSYLTVCKVWQPSDRKNNQTLPEVKRWGEQFRSSSETVQKQIAVWQICQVWKTLQILSKYQIYSQPTVMVWKLFQSKQKKSWNFKHFFGLTTTLWATLTISNHRCLKKNKSHSCVAVSLFFFYSLGLQQNEKCQFVYWIIT